MNHKGKELDKKNSRKKAKLRPVAKTKYRNLKSNVDKFNDDDDDFITPKVKRTSRHSDSLDD